MWRLIPAVLVLACAAGPARAAQEVRLWHSMRGLPGVYLEVLAARFNASQGDYRVVTAYKGPADDMLLEALGAPTDKAPDIVQVSETGTAQLLAVRAAVPLWQAMAQAGERLDPASDVPAVASYFSDSEGRLLALPIATATPILYYNRDAFRRAKLDPDHPPRTWYRMSPVLGALIASGSRCGFTTTLPAWVIENISAWHNERFATEHNGMSGQSPRLAFDHALVLRWVAMLASWRRAGYFTYFGPGTEAESRFASGDCAVLTASSESYGKLRREARFDLGVAQLPYYDDLNGVPQNTLGGGAALWVMAGRSAAAQRGAARFLAYLARPEIQAEWHEKTGYLPLSRAAYRIARANGFYKSHPGDEIAVRQLLERLPTRDSRGIRLLQLARIRQLVDEELESVWREHKTPLDALRAAVARGNLLLGGR